MIDFVQIRAAWKQYILKRIAEHPAKQPVKYVQFGYEVVQGGLFCVFFDTRTDAGPDGTWTVRLKGNSLEMPELVKHAEQFDDAFGIALGEMIKSLVFELRAQGAFDPLAKQADCEFGIEEMNGLYGWPAWEDRRKENLV